ncbi:MAG: hypothetical protein ACSLE3_03765, partial [Microbacteriaceae bacterium]
LAANASNGQGAYIGLFGGAGAAAEASLQQKGTVLVNQFLSLPVNADGSTESGTDFWAGGVQAGYEWGRLSFGQSGWGLKPAAEVEGIHPAFPKWPTHLVRFTSDSGI